MSSALLADRIERHVILIPTASYLEQLQRWPHAGRHILAHYNDETIIVYQAYCPAIGHFAAENGHFGGQFNYMRMSWIKPNFLWMMHRSDWARSKDQEVVLAVRLRRSFFDSLLEQSVASSFQSSDYADHKDWKIAVDQSHVRLQWDPDHLPNGDKCERRAIQLGLRADALEAYGRREVVEIIDVSNFVAEQRDNVHGWKNGRLATPVEHVYLPANRAAGERVGLDQPS